MSDIPPVIDLPEMKKLQTLESVISEPKILQCFARSQVETIKFLHFGGCGKKQDVLEHQPFIDFLTSQHKLTKLAIRSVDYDFQLFRTDIFHQRMPFHLTKLSLLDFDLQKSPNDYNNLLKFMKHHTNTIKELELGRKFPNFIYEFVLEKCTNLKSLRLRVNELPNDMHLKDNRSINNLILIDFPPLGHGCPPALEEFFLHVPNVTDLTLLESGDTETMILIASALTELNTLNVKNFTESMFLFMVFPNLTSLNIHKLDDNEIDWDGFTTGNPGITELTIEIVSNYCLNANVIETITENLKLRTLRIGNGFSASKRFYDIVNRNCRDLKILQLPKSSAIGGKIDVPGLILYDTNLNRCCDGLETWTDYRLPDDRGSAYQIFGAAADDFFGEDYFESSDDSDSEEDLGEDDFYAYHNTDSD